MNWYKLTFRQIQPIHLGYKKHGVINETRIFITGQTMWGALTGFGLISLDNYIEDNFPHQIKKGIYENEYPQNEL